MLFNSSRVLSQSCCSRGAVKQLFSQGRTIITQCCRTLLLHNVVALCLQISSEGSTLRPTAHRRAEVSTKWPHEPKHTLAKKNNDPKRCAYRFYNAPFMLRLVRRAVDNRSPEGLRGLGAFAPPVPSTT